MSAKAFTDALTAIEISVQLGITASPETTLDILTLKVLRSRRHRSRPRSAKTAVTDFSTR